MITKNHPQIGRHVEYTATSRDGKTVNSVTGVVTALQGGHVLRDINTGERFNGYKLRIKPDDGSRAIWTTAMKESVQ